MIKIKKILVLGIIGAIFGGIIGWVVQTFEPIGTDSAIETTLGFALIGAIAVNLTAWITMHDKW